MAEATGPFTASLPKRSEKRKKWPKTTKKRILLTRSALLILRTWIVDEHRSIISNGVLSSSAKLAEAFELVLEILWYSDLVPSALEVGGNIDVVDGWRVWAAYGQSLGETTEEQPRQHLKFRLGRPTSCCQSALQIGTTRGCLPVLATMLWLVSEISAYGYDRQ